MKYTIPELVITFQDHAKQAAKNQKDMLKKFKENNPGQPLPEHFKDDFNLPHALSVICKEIMKLQRTIAVKDFH